MQRHGTIAPRRRAYGCDGSRPRALRGSARLLLCALLTSWSATAWAKEPPEAPAEKAPEPLRVLLVGNSYTRFNDMPELLQALADSVPNGPRLEISVSARAGARLYDHWKRGHALRQLEQVQPTHVVLQDHSLAAFLGPRLFKKYARRFKERIDAVGARTVLFATWARHRASRLYTRGRVARVAKTPVEMQARIDALYQTAGETLHAPVAPVGDAWLMALSRFPDLRLHLNDGAHPTRRGSFLAACVLYGVLTGESPLGLRYRPPGMDPEDHQRLLHVAAEVLDGPPPESLAQLEAPEAKPRDAEHDTLDSVAALPERP